MTNSKQYVSQEKLEELQKELTVLKGPRRLEIADLLKRAKEYGDLSENSEYAEAREEQARVEARIFELEEMLRRTEVVVAGGPRTGVVQVGSHIVVKKAGKELNYEIVGSNEAKPEDSKISNESPIGKALLGRSVGETVVVTTPTGETKYEIVKIA
ncbi:MAG: transcription elongation factor GreA [Patescibacteria group bacterium]